MLIYKNVRKNYGRIAALDDFSLEIKKGEFFGLLGPNGAGKTTLIRATTTLTPINSGSIMIDGEYIDRNLTRTKRKLGIVPQYSNLEKELSAFENLEFHGRLYGMNGNRRRQRAKELLDFAGLSDCGKAKAKTFSGGMQRKLMIVKALMHSPEIMLLDEPTVGLDAQARRKIWDLMRALHSEGLTILLTTHYLEEAELLCSTIGMIDCGKLIKTGTPACLVKEAGNFVLEYFERGETRQQFFQTKDEALSASKNIFVDFKIREANLEDTFILLTQKRLAGEKQERL